MKKRWFNDIYSFISFKYKGTSAKFWCNDFFLSHPRGTVALDFSF